MEPRVWRLFDPRRQTRRRRPIAKRWAYPSRSRRVARPLGGLLVSSPREPSKQVLELEISCDRLELCL